MSITDTSASIYALRQGWEMCLAIRDSEYRRARAHRLGEACDVPGCTDDADAHTHREEGAQACAEVLADAFISLLDRLRVQLDRQDPDRIT